MLEPNGMFAHIPGYRPTRFEEIEGFPDYMVGETGEIVNVATGGMPLQQSRNNQGLPKITLVYNHRPYTRSPAVLVAKAFVMPEREDFDTVIHLNNDRLDCRAENLRWRPRWFAIAFHKQFNRESIHLDHVPVMDVNDKRYHYACPKDAVMALGILYKDIVLSTTNETYTFPTMQVWTRVF